MPIERVPEEYRLAAGAEQENATHSLTTDYASFESDLSGESFALDPDRDICDKHPLIEAAIDVMELLDDVASPPRLTRGCSGERILSDPLRTGAAPLPAARPG